jgi:HAD superfamily hydrolase (TIGR01549 family)
VLTRQQESGPDSNGTDGPNRPALLFDLDGTLVDTAYLHVTVWREALEAHKISVPDVRIHRSVGMSGKLMLRGIFSEQGIRFSFKKAATLEKLDGKNFEKRLSAAKPLPGAVNLLNFLTRSRIRWAIATTGNKKDALRLMRSLRVPANVPLVTGDDVEQAKPHPDVFFLAAERLKVPLENCTVIGDSTWDMLAARRAKALGVGLLCGGYSATELAEAGAFRIYKDPAELLGRITEIGVVRE